MRRFLVLASLLLAARIASARSSIEEGVGIFGGPVYAVPGDWALRVEGFGIERDGGGYGGVIMQPQRFVTEPARMNESQFQHTFSLRGGGIGALADKNLGIGVGYNLQRLTSGRSAPPTGITEQSNPEEFKLKYDIITAGGLELTVCGGGKGSFRFMGHLTAQIASGLSFRSEAQANVYFMAKVEKDDVLMLMASATWSRWNREIDEQTFHPLAFTVGFMFVPVHLFK